MSRIGAAERASAAASRTIGPSESASGTVDSVSRQRTQTPSTAIGALVTLTTWMHAIVGGTS
jgi:hypothetical protein